MRRESHIFVLICSALAGLALIGGCTLHENLTEVTRPNSLPETQLTARSPQPLESGFTVTFRWSGSDQDGQIAGYQWKLCDLGVDGFDVQDSLTADPVTGQVINPWQFTTDLGKTLVLPSAGKQLAGFGTVGGKQGGTQQTYTFFVRALDEKGAVDPEPARVHFTPTTILPYVFVDRPPNLHGYVESQPIPPTITFGFTAIDPDSPLGASTRFRYIFKRAWHVDHYVHTKYEFDQVVDDVLSFSDPDWSVWIPYWPDPALRTITFNDQPQYDEDDNLIHYLFAVQVRDSSGAVTVDRVYARNVENVYVSSAFTPLLTVHETYLGTEQFTGIHGIHTFDIASTQPLKFSWLGDAGAYGGTIEAYRWGWDLMDPDDPDDPGWAVMPGTTPAHLEAPLTTFSTGIHVLTIQCRDNSDQMTRATYVLDLVPVPDPSHQLPLLLVDDVQDRASNGWTSAWGAPLDNDQFRDAFWEGVLTGSGGVHGFNSVSDVADTEVHLLSYRNLVNYRVVVWTTRYAQNTFIWDNFKPLPTGEERYVWLGAYQQVAGNLLLTGSRALNEFIEEKQWMIPWVFDTDEEILEMGGTLYYVGFGVRDQQNGTPINVGTLRYPYWGMGVSVLDHVTPRYHVYGQVGPGSTGNSARNGSCVGVKGLILDPDFAVSHLGGGGVFPDTILTDAVIDWKDLDPAYRDELLLFYWNSDEFYDGNITDRSTPWFSQICDGSPCLEPMFRIYSRFDWVDDLHLAAGDPDWPVPYFNTPAELQTACGYHALDSYDPAAARTLTTSQVLGFVSHKLEADKPNPVGDVMWGFDPYRFDHVEIEQAIQWVLGEHFGLTMMP